MFSARPYSEVSIAPLLAAADVQAPTLYHHFGDKEGLYVAWAHEAFESLKNQLQIPHAISLQDGLAAFANIFFNASNFDVAQVVRDVPNLARDSSRESVYGAYFQAVYEPLCALLLQGMERGELAAEPIGRIADVFLAGLNTLRSQAEKDPAGIAAWYATRFLRGHHA